MKSKYLVRLASRFIDAKKELIHFKDTLENDRAQQITAPSKERLRNETMMVATVLSLATLPIMPIIALAQRMPFSAFTPLENIQLGVASACAIGSFTTIMMSQLFERVTQRIRNKVVYDLFPRLFKRVQYEDALEAHTAKNPPFEN